MVRLRLLLGAQAALEWLGLDLAEHHFVDLTLDDLLWLIADN